MPNDFISNAPAPAAAPSAGSPSSSSFGEGSGSAPAHEGSPAGQDGGSSDGRGSRDSNGRFQAPQAGEGGNADHAPAAAPVTLRSLKDLADADPSTYSPEERKKVRISARNGIQDDAELDARTTGKPFVKDGAARPEKPADGTPPNQEPKDQAGQPLHKLVKAISPYLDPADPDKAVENVKTLHSNLHKANERANQLESYYSEVETGIEGKLKKGLAGVREIFQAFNLNPDEFLGNAPAAAPAASAPNGVRPAAIPGDLPDLHDDDFLTGAQIKGLIPTISAQLRRELKAEFEKEYGPLKESHSQITAAVKADAEFRQTQGRRETSIKDAQFHSDYYGKFHPEFKLTDAAAKVWEESVAEEKVNGKVQLKLKAQQHPEWPKLKEILSFRQKEYLEAGNDAATYNDFLYRRINESGNFFELVRNAEQKGKESVLTAQHKRLQPALAQRGNGGPLDSFRVPKSEEDIVNMTPEQRKELRKRLMSGKIQVR